MVRKDETPVRTIIVVVVHVSVLRRVLLKIGMVRRDLCHFRDSSLAVQRIAILLARFWQIGSLVRLDSFPPFRVIARLSA